MVFRSLRFSLRSLLRASADSSFSRFDSFEEGFSESFLGSFSDPLLDELGFFVGAEDAEAFFSTLSSLGSKLQEYNIYLGVQIWLGNRTPICENRNRT